MADKTIKPPQTAVEGRVDMLEAYNAAYAVEVASRLNRLEEQFMALLGDAMNALKAVATRQDQPTPPIPKEVEPSTLRGSDGPVSMAFKFPTPYDYLTLVCGPDREAPIGVFCWAEVKKLGGERDKMRVAFMTEAQWDVARDAIVGAAQER